MIGRWGGIPDVLATRVHHAAVDDGSGVSVALDETRK